MTSWDRHATSWNHTYKRDVVASFGVGITLDGGFVKGTQVILEGLKKKKNVYFEILLGIPHFSKCVANQEKSASIISAIFGFVVPKS